MIPNEQTGNETPKQHRSSSNQHRSRRGHQGRRRGGGRKEPAYAQPPPEPAGTEGAQPPSPLGIRDAIEKVQQITVELKKVLEEMEEVLEILEEAEQQKNLDEKEIHSLQQALKHLQRFRDRDSGSHSHSHAQAHSHSQSHSHSHSAASSPSTAPREDTPETDAQQGEEEEQQPRDS